MNATPDDLLSRLREHTDLGHASRDKAFLRQVAAVCSSPGTSAPQAAGKAAERAGLADATSLYRFVGNEKVSLADLRAARAQTVLAPVPPGADLLVIHDVSQLDSSRHHSKSDRRLIGDHNGMGYEYVSCIAVDPQAGTTWGVVHDTLVHADGPDDREVMDYDYEPLFAHFSKQEKQRLRENHRHQMAVHVRGTASLLANWHVIDVADREFDDIFLLDECRQNNRDFVIRSSANRNVQIPDEDWVPESALAGKQSGHPCPPGYVCVNLKRLIEHVPLHPYKTLPLDARNRVVDEANAKRLADVSIGSFRARLYRQAKRNGKYYRPPRAVDVHVGVIREVNPPKAGTPVCWVLFTSLPAETFEDMAFVGRCYELRWTVEELFRLLKSGYRVLYCRLNNVAKIARYLVILTLAAMVMLNLKRQVGLPSKGKMSDEDYRRVKTAMCEPDNREIDLNLRLFAFIAKNGGWLGRRRDPIGPTVLMRGMLHLLAVLDTSARYGQLIQEALRNPDVLRRLFCV
jgi:hypothetical protein